MKQMATKLDSAGLVRSHPTRLSTCYGFNIVLGSGHYSLSPIYIIEKAI